MKILIVGAGAVGSVFGYHLYKGGAEVSYLVKPRHLDSLKDGIQLYFKKTASKKSKSVLFTNYKTFSDAKELASVNFDYVILTMPSNALQGPWLPELLDVIGGAAVLVSLQPGMLDQEYILGLGRVGRDRFVSGSIPIVSYHAPLPGENIRPSGYVSWTPPGQKVGLEGPTEKTAPLAEVFSRGGMPAHASPNMSKDNVVPSVFLQMVVAGLEAQKWSFNNFYQKNSLELVSRALQEALPIAAEIGKISNPMKSSVVRCVSKPAMLKLILKQTRWVVPFDFEEYMKAHFTKVGEQMHQGVDLLVTHGKKSGLPTTALEELSKNVPQ